MHQPPDLPPLIQALCDPARYPDSALQQVELLQTHISWVLLAGDFAYKIKKPIKLPFLDFSTLALRKRYCEDELRLNRRYAPDIYLDVVAIRATPNGPALDADYGTPLEYAVRMRRFDEAGRLDRLCARGALTAAHVSDLAATLVAFHATAAVAPAGSRFGSPAQVLAPMMDNFHDLGQLLAPAADDDDLRQRLQALRNWTQDQFARLTPLITARKAAGSIRECHGDLHLANMVLIDQRVRLFDCLEFNQDLRWIDVTCDHAFAYIDLLEHGRGGLANWFANQVFECSGDYEATPLLRLYAVYRAMVRAKVAAIRCSQTGGAGDDNRNDVRLFIDHAQRLVEPAPLRLVITHGLAGCGKTFASSRLLQSDAVARTLRLRSDVERKRLFGLAPDQRSGSATSAGIYAPDAHARTYARLQTLAAGLLHSGWSVVVDAAFLQRREREAFHAIAAKAGAQFAILAPQAGVDVLRQRITSRLAAGRDASEATLAVLDSQLQWIEALGSDERALMLEPTPD